MYCFAEQLLLVGVAEIYHVFCFLLSMLRVEFYCIRAYKIFPIWLVRGYYEFGKIFCGESSAFLLVFWGLLLVLNGVFRAVCGWFCALSMLLSVTFNVAKRDVCVCCLAGKEISKEEGDNRLSPSSISSCSGVINFRLAQVILTSWMFVAGSV